MTHLPQVLPLLLVVDIVNLMVAKVATNRSHISLVVVISQDTVVVVVIAEVVVVMVVEATNQTLVVVMVVVTVVDTGVVVMTDMVEVVDMEGMYNVLF